MMAFPKLPQTAIPFEGVGNGVRWSRRYCLVVNYREPKAGEFYLSGAIPMAYKARQDLMGQYWIVEPEAFGPHRSAEAEVA